MERIFNHINYKDIFNNIKKELGNKSELQSKKFMDQMIKYFEIKNTEIIKELKMIINSKKYENIVKSIKYFFDNFSNKKLTSLENININLSEMSLSILLKTLNQLKRDEIFDYESNSHYYSVFISLYEKKEAIDFLMSKLDTDLHDFEVKLITHYDQTNRRISIKDIEDTIDCLKHFRPLLEYNSKEIIKYITLLDEEIIKKFENFSKKYHSIIELDRKKGKDNFKEIYDIIEDASLLFNLDGEDFVYKINGETIEIKNIEQLIKLKNKINIHKTKNIKENEFKKDDKHEQYKLKDIFQIKCDKLIFFKDIISKLEIIYDKINILKKKGFNIPIVINIVIRYPKVLYKLNHKEKEFNKIKEYLFNIKNDYDEQLDIIYKNDKYLRLLYGKLFRKIKQHQEGDDCNINDLIRYILNKANIVNKNNRDIIQDSDNLYIGTIEEDYEDEYKEYTKYIFDGISKYLIDLFKKNNLDLQKHYENMLIKSEFNNRGISIKKCKKISMEEYILFLFIEKLGKIPIAQNILVCNNETSIEELQSFLYRAILCNYNTLFVVKILESFSNFQHIKMYNYIIKILSVKFENYKKKNEGKDTEKLDKSKSSDYLDSYIVFVYEKLENENAFKVELGKYTRNEGGKNDEIFRKSTFFSNVSQNINTDKDKEKEKDLDDINTINDGSFQEDEFLKSIPLEFDIIKNIKVISSDICGLGKSFRIKKDIGKKGLKYYHFSIGGKLTKDIIYKKIVDLFKKIKNDSKKKSKDINKKIQENLKYSEFNNVAIHLDIIETKETSLINEFLFSFLITKFYINNGNIIYIPSNIKIFLEVPNSFENYLKKFGILNVFNIENIILGELKKNEKDVPMLPLQLHENERKQFRRLNGFKEDKEIEKFIKDTFNSINIKEYSYHQIKTFIKLYISQFASLEGKLEFLNSKGENITKKCIEYFTNNAKYFTNGGFAKLIMEKRNIKDIFELCLDPYENDLSKAKLDIPLIFIDKKSKKYKLKILSDMSKVEDKFIQNNILSKDIDIVYLKNGSVYEISEESDNSNKLDMKATNQVLNPSYNYLARLKIILNLPNDLVEDKEDKKSLLSILDIDLDNYVITEDNYKKMVLLYNRIKANVPVIIMGETGCGKTSLIKKLSQILNHGLILVEIINIYPGITDEKIIKKMKIINDEAKSEKYKGKELWVFFDEINTCSSPSLLTEIFINRTFNLEKLEDNIRLIGACIPFRKRKELIERYGLTRENYEDEQLVYKVEQLPQSLLYFVFNFGSLEDNNEKNYIKSIIHKLFIKEEEKLHDLTAEAISKCHIFLRRSFGNDPSIVSLREIARFKKCVEFFDDYFIKKNDFLKMSYEIINNNDSETKKVNKIKSIICSIYVCYYIRLKNDNIRNNFDYFLRKTILQITNVHCEEIEEEKKCDLFYQIRYRKLKDELRDNNFQEFSDLLKIEEDFLLAQIELDQGIGKNQLIKENLFLIFLAVVTKIPLIIVGKPGTGKSLSAQLIFNSMRGKYSKSKNSKKSFFSKYPRIYQTYFQGSESTEPEDVEELFKKTKESNNKYENNLESINMILFDKMDLAEKSPSNPLKVLHNKLEYGGQAKEISFIGISNYSLDNTIINRALVLSLPNLEDKLEQLKFTAKSIVKSISEDIFYEDNLIFNILARAYFKYKYYLSFIKKLIVLKQYSENNNIKGKNFREIEREQEFIKLLKKDKKINSEFHGNRDFYNIIKGVAIEGSKLNSILEEKQIVPIINKFIERNFGGINYYIDIDFYLDFDDIELEMEALKNEILNEKINKIINDDEEDEIPKKRKENENNISSVFLFKKIYNLACTLEKSKDNENIDAKIYQIGNDYLDKYDLNKCIQDNINDKNSRYLLLEIDSNIEPLINRYIRVQNPDMDEKNNIETIIGSPFQEDNNSDYKSEKVNEIKNLASQEEKLIILQNLDSIQPYLYDLYNMNYKIIDEQKFFRICFENFSEQLTPVSDSFKIINLVDKKFVEKVDTAFLNRFEKIKITSFKKLLNNSKKDLIKAIEEEIGLNDEIYLKRNKFNYDLGHLLINSNEEEISGLVYYLLSEAKKEDINENNIKDKIFTKISNLLPQDIVVILPDTNPIKRKYYEKKKFYNFKQYMKALNAGYKELSNYKISIIYTFSNIVNSIDGYNLDEFMISDINSEEKLKTLINDIKNKNKKNYYNNYILIRFEDFNSKKIQYIADYILNVCKKDDYHYILIIYIHRNFNSDNKLEQKIYSIPNIYDNINQLFIDNLEGPEITLKELLTKNIKDIMFHDIFDDLEKEFRETLIDFVYDRMSNTINYDNKSQVNYTNKEKYCKEIKDYMLYDDPYFKNKIIEKVEELIEIDINIQGNCNSLIYIMLKENYINKDKTDIISCIIAYIKENIFSKYLKFIFDVLEDNNFLTTLLVLNKDKICKLDKNDSKRRPDNSKILKELEDKFLKEIKMYEDKKYETKFLINYKIPGFYNLYKVISNYLTKDICTEFYNNEKDLRDIDLDEDENFTEKIENFHEKEDELLQKVLKIIENNKLYNDLINKITPDLILNDYISFYLEKYLGIYSKSFYNIISLLLDIRFSDEKNIIINNQENPINIVLIKIMWIESNSNYIESILKAFEFGKVIYNDKEGSNFYQKIFNTIIDQENPIKYIVNKNRAEHMKEINECFYLFLAGLCLSIANNNLDKMEISIGDYYIFLKNINKIIKNIDDELNVFLNELYIIDELINIIEYNPNTNKIIIQNIRNCLIENSRIIQKNLPNEITKLIENFYKMNEELKKIKNKQTKEKYYSTIKYIYKKEIQKINDKIYHEVILKEIIKENEIIKISNDIFQILLESYTDLDYFEDSKKDLLKSKDNIINLLNRKLSDESKDYYLPLSETIIYFFDKNSLIYLKDFSDIKNFVNEKKGHLKVFKDCVEFLYKLNNNSISEGLTYIAQLFCIAYIKSFCYVFIKMHNKTKFSPENVIKIINESDKINMIKLYIYKIIYNKNNKQINVFTNNNIKKKYKLETYNGFNDFFKEEEIEKLEQFTYDNNKTIIYKKLKEYAEKQFENKITKNDISLNKNDFDNFYMAAYKLILLKLKNEDFINDNSYINFYPNVCVPLYEKDDNDGNKLITLMKFFFDKNKFSEIKKEYLINSEDIEALLFGYRYCLNEVKDKEEDNIYSYLYNKNNLSFFDQKFYPGNDNNWKDPYYQLYNKIVNHFKEKPDEGCYVCLCDKGYYHSITAGFPGFSEVNMRCINCGNDIGAEEFYREEKDENNENKIINIKDYRVAKNDNYFRIFKDKEQIKELKKINYYYKKLESLKYMTLEEFKENYIRPLYNKEKGLNKIDIINFKNENKIIRNLSQISYRLLNYILYCHLFFAKLFTQSGRFDNYLPQGLSWISVIKECFNKLKLELENKGIKNIEIFMNCIFNDLFDKLHNQKCINKYDDLIKFEDELEELIKQKCKIAKEEINKYKELEKECIKDEKSAIALVKEIYDKNKYKKIEYPFYQYFYYSDYLDEDYIENILKYMDENTYPVLAKYLKNKEQKHSKEKDNIIDNFSLDNLNLFNKALNLFSDKYSNKISEEFSKRQIIKTSEIYRVEKNAKLIDDFIKLYNSFSIENDKGDKLELNVEKNCIFDFLIIDDNKYGKSYKDIYKIFIDKQNNELESLINIKIKSGEFNINCKNRINVQQIKENEIFSSSKESKFIEIIFNSSYRKYLDTYKHENYNEYEIRLKQIESEMTNSLLKNKKLLNDNIKVFNFVFTYEINNLISDFKYEKMPINMNDKEAIYKFIKKYDGNNEIYKILINNFITLIEYLIKEKEEKYDKINENTNISDIEIVKNLKNISKEFKELFQDNNHDVQIKLNKNNDNYPKVNLNVSKIIDIFNYFLKLIFKYVKEDIEKHHEKNIKKEVYNLNEKDMTLKKGDLASAIRLFITLILFREKEKEKDEKVKSNEKNIVDCLKNKDLWKSSLYNNKSRFEKDLSNLKNLNIKIKEILFFYYYLVDNKDEGFENEIVNYIKMKEEEIKNQELPMENAKYDPNNDLDNNDNSSDKDSEENNLDSDNDSGDRDSYGD